MWFWLTAALIVAAYAALFLFVRRPVALRMARLGWILTAIAAARAVMIVLTRDIHWYVDPVLAALALVFLALLRAARRRWLVRAGAADFREQLLGVCRGLFLPVDDEEPGRLILRPKGQSLEMRVVPLGRRLLWLSLPPSARHAKVDLLVQWLRKQFPGPLPYLTLSLKKEPAHEEPP